MRPDVAPLFPAAGYDVVALGVSEGGLAALTAVLAPLPATFPAALLIVRHMLPRRPSLLAALLAGRTALRVVEATDGAELCAGTAWVAPPDRHLLVDGRGRLALSGAPKEHFSRPAVDPLFVSVAERFGPRAIAVVLTGGDGDGASGTRAISAAGGVVLAQDQGSSRNGSMPRAAAATGRVDRVLPLEDIAAALLALVGPGTATGSSREAACRPPERKRHAQAHRSRQRRPGIPRTDGGDPARGGRL